MAEAEDIIERLIHLEDVIYDGNVCSMCGGKGFLLDENHKAIECQCQKSKLLQKLYKEASIPVMYFGMTIVDNWDRNLDAFGMELGARKEDKIRIGEFINRYIKILPALSDGKKAVIVNKKQNKKLFFNSLLLVGGQHSGKTMIVSILCQEMINRAKTAKYYEWHNLSSILAEFRNSDSVDEVVDDFRSRDLIAIDGVMPYDLDSQSFLFNLNRISSTRLQSGKPIVITCSPEYTERSFKTQIQNPEKSATVWNQLLEDCLTIHLP